ncbi:EpsG family protein [Clostridium tagluense]|uniref:EpsG family protein n=1 Tax=Clostridium tagluense TaxID=360422 RepID=UPI001CF321A5|nr:EpsG family protein [Clostridium tagluense]MCB2312030.1 EpsG family protein [Clostridium tagluense]MCB2316617.1 EpsG family protein [Clostridium tagluense]MCB2321447.1 EpsG family protein [Clostridium tagluense]MCB2326459.1 EpsG family protein [Clostridium tagluense]MCB2331209.1 EpsG family protein [Clostridium tagluense]
MLFSLLIFLSLIFVIIEISGVNYKTSKMLAVIPIFLLCITVSFNRMNNDYIVYQIAFANDGTMFEFGYQYLIKVLKYFGQEYEAIIFLTGILLVFIFKKMMKNNKHINVMILLYCIFPLVYDINQIRNLLMYLIVIISLEFIRKKSIIRYYIGIFLAYSIHSFALIYIPFYYLCKKDRKKFIKIILSLFCLFTIISPIIMKVLLRFFPYKIESYLASGKPKGGIIAIVVYVIVDVFTVWWVDKKISKKLNFEEKNEMEVLYRFVWYSILILPFTVYFLEIQRLQRNALLIKYYYCALAMNHLKKAEKIVTLILLLISVVLPILLMIYSSEFYLYDYLDKNFILEYLKNRF